jgi:hypothetical protein
MDKATPVPRQRVFELADSAIGLFLEFRDQHGYGEEAARSLAVSEVMDGEAARAEVDPPRLRLKEVPFMRGCGCLLAALFLLLVIAGSLLTAATR